jgi:acyl carrier protein
LEFREKYDIKLHVREIIFVKGVLMSFTEEKVMDIVAQHLDKDRNEIKMDANFINDLGADSLDLVELVMAFEEEFKVDIPDDAAEKITTVKKAVEFIEKEISSSDVDQKVGE